MNQPNTVNKVEIQCACGVHHVVKIGGKETPCRCGAGVKAVWVDETVQPFSMHAPDHLKGKKPVIVKWFWPTGQRLGETRR